MFDLLNNFQSKTSISNTKSQVANGCCLRARKIFFFLCLAAVSWLLTASPISASRIEELKQKISDQNSQIEQIEKDIEKYKNQIAETTEQAGSLKTEITRLENIRAKLRSDISLTQKKIETAGYNIERLNLEISDKVSQIADRKETLGELIRKIREADEQTIVEIALAHEQMSDFFTDIENMDILQKDIKKQADGLGQLKNALEDQKNEESQQKRSLENLKSTLTDQRTLTEQNKAQKDSLLKETKNKEANYKKILAEKIAQKEQFEREMAELESQLRIAIDPKSLPSAGSGVLAWPLNSVYITQYFGNTAFATQNPQIYNGKGHTGVDFRAATGELIKAAATGVVSGIGNTDEIRGCYSYGKWVLIKHNNGLSTLYAHLSLIKVSEGQQIDSGQLIGYSGTTGYATGPHLHFAVYASQGVQITKFTNSVNCKNAIVPIADIKAYLNPLSYL